MASFKARVAESMKIKDLQEAQQKNLLWKIVWDNLPLKEAKDEL